MAEAIENRGPELLAINITFLTTAILSILLRCYVRGFMVKAFGTDDYLMVAAAIFFTLYGTFSSVGTIYGTGRHHEDLELEDISMAMKCWWFCYLWYSLCMILSKFSIGWFLLRVTTSKVHAWIIYIAMGSTAISGLIFFFVTMFQCKPIPYFWDKTIEGGTCVNIEIIIALAFLYSSFSVISDFIFAVLPGVIVWKLQLHRRTKIMLFPLLAMGCVASSAVIARFPFLPKFREPDFLWNTTDIAIWSTVEQGLAITAGSLATLRPIVQAMGRRLGWSSVKATAPTGDYNLSSSRMSRFAKRSNTSSHDVVELTDIHRDEDVGGEKGRKIFRDSKQRVQPRLTPVGENDSEEELHSPRSWFKQSAEEAR